MALLSGSDLKYSGYRPAKDIGDDPKKIGSPDKDMLNRLEKYEVLDFINAYAEKHKITGKMIGIKIETWLHDGTIAKDVHSRAQIEALVTAQLKKDEGKQSRIADFLKDFGK